MKCMTCGRGIRSSAKFCPYCGSAVQGLANVVAAGTPSASCPGCGADNLANARFCSSCGRQLPHAFGLAAQAAADAAKTMPTSSSGRDPAGEAAQAERTAFLRRRDERAAERGAVAVPALTGDSLRDLAAAEEHFTKVDALWDELDIRVKTARAEAGLIPAAGDAAEIADLQRRADIAWASRQAAFAHRQRLWDQEQQTYGTRGMGLPPGTSERSWQPW